jgi:ubiquinone/menaquinone biosynthesis C-methylase UbiE
VNDYHLQYLASPEWASTLRDELLPWVIGSRDLGDDFLEIGPGPGVTTDLLRSRTSRLTAIELDTALARALTERLAESDVEVVNADASDMPFDGDRFSGAACLTMLHHVPSAAQQDRLFSEVVRVLRPGASLLGSDTIESPEARAGHVDDVFVPVDPTGLSDRLIAAGFEDVDVEVRATRVRFAARKAH